MSNSTPPKKKKPEELRSQQWFGRQDRDGFAYRSWVKGKGVPHDQFDGRPVIGICNTFSELTPCNCALPHAGRAGEDRRLRGRRLPARVPGDVAGRDAAAPDRDAVPQPRQHGRRGKHPRQPDRRRGAADGLRQDHAVAGDGRVQRRPADHRRLRRPDAQRQMARPGTGLGHRRVEHERAGARRHAQAAGLLRGRELHAPQPRPLHDHGHGLDDGQHGRGAGPRPAGQRRLSGGRRPAQRAGAHGRAAHRRHGARGPEAVEDPDAPGLRERDQDAGRHRRLHQRRDPPDRDRPAHRRRAGDRGLRPPRAASCPAW